MFKVKFLLELISGKLSEEGYANILGSIAAMVRSHHWKKTIIVSSNSDEEWSDEDIRELSHMYFEWIIANNKLKYINKISHDYISYYFTQMLVSFVANKIKEEQQKTGISFQKCLELVKIICEEEYEHSIISGKNYVKALDCCSEKIIEEVDDIIKYMPHIPVNESTRQFKPIVKMAIEDVLMSADGYLSIENLCKAIFKLFDQSALSINSPENSTIDQIADDSKYTFAINKILSGLSKSDAMMFVEYIFQDHGQVSLAEIAYKYGLAKSSVHKKIENFKNKIFSVYIPENENDGVMFLQKLAQSLDEIAK